MPRPERMMPGLWQSRAARYSFNDRPSQYFGGSSLLAASLGLVVGSDDHCLVRVVHRIAADLGAGVGERAGSLGSVPRGMASVEKGYPKSSFIISSTDFHE